MKFELFSNLVISILLLFSNFNYLSYKKKTKLLWDCFFYLNVLDWNIKIFYSLY